MANILIIEDDTHINQMLQDLLKQAGHQTLSAYSGTEGLMYLKAEQFDLILLDLMLPGKTGYDVLTEIRQVSQIPIIVLTAIDDEDNTVSLLNIGANDYVTKPFNNQVLLARIDVQLRNVALTTTGTKKLQFKDLILDLELFQATLNGQSLDLLNREFEILKVMLENPKKVFSKNNLYESVWQEDFLGNDNVINVHMSKIRTKLAKIKPDEEYIQTVWGIGFKLKE